MPPQTLQERRRGASLAACDAALDAAERVIVRDGIGRLTLDAVAREASISKGGLLHHFPTKDALMDALVARTVRAWREDLDAAFAREPEGPGRISRAFLGACLNCAEAWTETVRRSGVVLVAALVHDPARVEPLRQLHRELAAKISKDGLPRGVGEAVKLAVDGLWFDWLFGFTELTPQRLAAVRSALHRLVDPCCVPVDEPVARTPRAARPARKVTRKITPSKRSKRA